ncbi:hypothetical protein BCAR13_760062 [Paraburkholderia caribensis]|nr:hypothetical protein BCAR13_760062 [Paraburkholderia caribensis]
MSGTVCCFSNSTPSTRASSGVRARMAGRGVSSVVEFMGNGLDRRPRVQRREHTGSRVSIVYCPGGGTGSVRAAAALRALPHVVGFVGHVEDGIVHVEFDRTVVRWI